MNKITFGIGSIKSAIPTIIKRIAVVAGAISLGLGSYGLISNDDLFIKIGGISTMISVGLPPLFGVKKDESTDC